MKKLFLFCCVLSLIGLLTDIGQKEAEGCTIGVACGKATADGRPLLWRNRDGSYRDYEVVYFKNGRFKLLAGAGPRYSQPIIGAGVNEFGFCIGGASAFNLKDKSGRVPGVKQILTLAVQQCVTVDDFESLLEQTNVSGRDSCGNIGVIDAFGGAAIFEMGNFSYTRFDATNPNVAPQGYIIRATYAFTGRSGPNYGRARYDRANQLWQQAIGKNQLDYRYVLRKVCRDLFGAEEISYTQAEMDITGNNALKVLNNQNAISRPGTTDVALFHGVKPDENPSLTTFWAILGAPIFSVAVPSWVIAESTAPELDGEEFSPICTAARDLYLANYVTDERQKHLLNPAMLSDIQAVTYPAEDRIFDQTQSIMTQWRQDYPTAQQVASFHRSMASQAMDALEKASEMLIQKGGATANLRIALHMRSVDKAKAFIEQGTNINVSDGHGYAPLHYAVQNNQKEIVELLISKNADVNVKDRSGRTPVVIAVRQNHRKIAKLLIEKGAHVTSVHIAAQGGLLENLRELIENGADVNAKDDVGMTPLHHTAERGHADVAKLLLDNGADVNAKEDRWGATPLNCTTWGDHRDLAELLIVNGANVNAKGHHGWTALHDAALHGRSRIAELLVAEGAYVNAKADKWARTPLHAAAKNGHKEVAELLIAKGADVNLKDEEGRTPLDIAVDQRHREIVELLRKHGAKE